MRTQPTNSTSTFDEKINKDRFLYTILSLIGQQVNVHLKDGAVIEGLFHSASDPTNDPKLDEFRLDLPLVRSISKRFMRKGRVQNTIVFNFNEISHVVARKVSKRDDGFETNSKIGAAAAETERKNMKQLWNRELERCNDAWVSDVKDEELPDEMDKRNTSGGKWDQFKHFKPLRPGSYVYFFLFEPRAHPHPPTHTHTQGCQKFRCFL